MMTSSEAGLRGTAIRLSLDSVSNGNLVFTDGEMAIAIAGSA
jgi:hypothetical protein